MRIVVFGYDFPHWKTEKGLRTIKDLGYDNVLVLLQPWKELTVPRSKRVFAFPPETLQHPRDVCNELSYRYSVVEHNDPETVELLNHHGVDVGIVLGARILKSAVITAFGIGILNLHPGVLPENRGLDNIKWSIVLGLPIGVTAHWIDSRVDAGRIVEARCLNVYRDDTVDSVAERNRRLEIETLRDILRNGVESVPTVPDVDWSQYPCRKTVSSEDDEALDTLFSEYKRRFARDARDTHYGCLWSPQDYSPGT